MSVLDESRPLAYKASEADRFLGAIHCFPESVTGRIIARGMILVAIAGLSIWTIEDLSTLLFGKNVDMINGIVSVGIVFGLRDTRIKNYPAFWFLIVTLVNAFFNLLSFDRQHLPYDAITILKSVLVSALVAFVTVRILEFFGVFTSIHDEIQFRKEHQML